MSYTINDTKKLKLQNDNKSDYPQALHDICNWLHFNKAAIEYHDLKEVKTISYNELQAMKEVVANCLKCIQYPEFIGINLDILEYCVPSLMLGLLEEIFHSHVTLLQITPSLFFHKWSTERLKTTILDKDSQLRVLLLGGEPFPSMKLILKASHLQNMTRLFNIYGITEISCWSSINEITKDNSADESYLGEPLSEIIFQIRNEDNEVITRGEGTLYIGSISRICIIGNEMDENLTKPIFRNTGDIVSTDDQGRIFYKGRRNNIIKRFGNKVNLQELQKVATELNFVRICATFWDAKSHKLYLCVSTTEPKEEFPKTELYATVGSHFGIICTVDLLKTNNKPYEIQLPNRIEASVLVLTEFHGIVGCYDGYIYCIHLKTGEVIWKFQTQDMVKCTAITCTQGNKIFVGSYDHYVYCLSIEDGTQIWKTEASEGGICATGCLHRESTSVLFGTLDGSCVALQQSSGQISWKRKLQDPIFVAPVVLRTGYVLFCSVAGALCCFDIETDCQMWRYMIHGNVFSYPVIWNVESTNNEYVILASHNKHVYCLKMPRKTERNEPKLKYTLQLPSPIFATPWCENGRMFVVCTDGILKVFDLSEGKLLAIKQLPGETFSSPVVHNNLVVLGCRDNNLYILKLCAT
ncbi:Acyl-CoA synthetase family member 4 [Camponotus floridanus]|uniref:Acyl-CoA synthetase family member 4 n=1 Tax=Camponotus floridanus TaxID=104421 RepID=E2ART5_CAMFO|nr:Acyl-CoA synthetase family member 4 [Camponotus floridanus]